MTGTWGFSKEKIVFLTGAGISAESGLRTFRGGDGLWDGYRIDEVASKEAWEVNPHAVLSFYNYRRREVLNAKPNKAHYAIARLTRRFEVVVITQNIDNLHEEAGSSNVIHLHGEILKARSTADASIVSKLSGSELCIGDLCAKKSQLRPDVVLFGEEVRHIEESKRHLREASRVVVVGTSLSVWPAAQLVHEAIEAKEKYMIGLRLPNISDGYCAVEGEAGKVVPYLADAWLQDVQIDFSQFERQ